MPGGSDFQAEACGLGYGISHIPKESVVGSHPGPRGLEKLLPLQNNPSSCFSVSSNFTIKDDMPRSFTCCQPALPDSMLTKGVDILNLVSPLEEDTSFISPGTQKRPFSEQARQCVSVLIKSGHAWPLAFISVPYSLHKNLQARKTLRT